jgi:hypothetical protein
MISINLAFNLVPVIEVLEALYNFSHPSPKLFDVRLTLVVFIFVELVHDFPTLINKLVSKFILLENLLNLLWHLVLALDLKYFYEFVDDFRLLTIETIYLL